MSDVTQFIIDKIAAPVLSGGFGVGTAVWRMSSSLAKRLGVLEVAWKRFKEEDYPRERNELIAAVNNALRALRGDLEALQGEGQKGVRERGDVRRLLSNTSNRVLQLEQRIAACEKDLEDLEAQWRQFAKEQGDQWQDMTRTLGQLEGFVKARSGPSGQFPQTK